MKKQQPTLRLVTPGNTRRRKHITINYPRFICFVSSVVILSAFVCILFLHANADEVQRVKTLEHYETVTVSYGDTLLEIAQTYSPDENVRGFMWEIMQQNNLEDTKIVAGERLSVPVYTVQQCSVKPARK